MRDQGGGAPALVLASKPQILTNEQLTLPDGSLVELKDGSRVEAVFSESERRVRLLAGEAYFTVAKEAERPFIVEADGVAVQAVGTVFNVRCDRASVEVLVTEGKVQVSDTVRAMASAPALADDAGASGELAPPALAQPAVMVAAGQRAVIARMDEEGEIRVSEATSALIEVALAWQGTRVLFNETLLAEAIAELNGRNRVQLVLATPALGSMRIGGTFRSNNIEGFVRLLELTLGVKAERAGDRITLR